MWSKSNKMKVVRNPFIIGIICLSYSQRLGRTMGTGHSSGYTSTPPAATALLFWCSPAKKAIQKHKVGRFGWHRTAFSARSRMKSTTISHFKYFPHQTFPLVSPDFFTHVPCVHHWSAQESGKYEDTRKSESVQGSRRL